MLSISLVADESNAHSESFLIMSKKMAGILIAYAVMLAGLGLILQEIAPAVTRVAVLTSLAGGGLCLLGGVAALAGLKGRAWSTLGVIGTALVLLAETVHAWMVSSGEGGGSGPVRLLLTVMMLLTVGMLMYLLHGERPPEFYHKTPGTSR